ncbi:PREDICTED: myrosinase-binding protein 2-like [Tarenaya hassleriana]|uniref:myrosinase-binding protein 2-like n=1 Tax=Tarenaya hassleriana TaxID=28532 RepID=UPI00053CA1EA|nr:PREDICTED: myrosinase-binding protein 2-like [Tarenaya hassleriana]
MVSKLSARPREWSKWLHKATMSTSEKLGEQGGPGGTTWDDGSFGGVRKVYVGEGDNGVTYVKFEYDKGGKLEEGGKLVGFHGRSAAALDALGAYFAPFFPTKKLQAQDKVPEQGGPGGFVWDDGSFDGVRKVYVGEGDNGVTYVKFEYDKGGKLEFVLDYPDEYITMIHGTCGKVPQHGLPIVTSLTFITSKQRTSSPAGSVIGSRFSLGKEGGKLIGFHGRSAAALDALGAYLLHSSLQRNRKFKTKCQNKVVLVDLCGMMVHLMV